MKSLVSLSILGAAFGLLIASAVGKVQPKAAASPSPIIDHSAELAALKSEISNLQSENARLVADAAAIHAAPLAVTAPGGGDQNGPDQPSARETPEKTPVSAGGSKRFYVAAPRPVQSCAGGVCMPADQGPRYQYQSRSSQPRRLFSGRLFGRR
jgi:hypothetical protein